jgi:hypothetical protein
MGLLTENVWSVAGDDADGLAKILSAVRNLVGCSYRDPRVP